ncbi:MAG: hypothetical protein R3C97_03290 [Geminicoccaceae bacterium]
MRAALEDGLKAAFADGSHAALLRSHPQTRDLIALFDLSEDQLLRLDDPHLSLEDREALKLYGIKDIRSFSRNLEY